MFTLKHYEEAIKHGRSIKELVAVAVTTRHSTNPRFNANGGDYDEGFTVLVDTSTNAVVGGRYWTSSDFGCCAGCGGQADHDCETTRDIPSHYKLGSAPDDEEVLKWGHYGYGGFLPIGN